MSFEVEMNWSDTSPSASDYELNNTTSNTTSSTDENFAKSAINCSLEYPECIAARYLWIIFSIALLIFGTIGNSMILLVMCQRSLRRTAFGCYLIVMSVTDTLTIWVALSRHLIKNLLYIDIRESNYILCWFQRFLLYGSSNSTVWLLTAVTFERMLSIYSPTRSIHFKNLNRTKVFIAIILLIQYSWNIHVFFTRGREYDSDGNVIKECGYVSESSKYFWKYTQTYLALVDYSIIPFLAMLGMNIAIIMRLRKRDKQYKKCTAVTDADQQVKTSSVSSKTLMLLPVSIFFLVTTLPALVFTGVELTTFSEGKARARMELADFFVSLLMYLNHSMNFLLYCLTGKMFRQSCWRLILRYCWCSKSQEKEPRWDTHYTRSPMTGSRNLLSTSTSNIRITPNGTPNATPTATPGLPKRSVTITTTSTIMSDSNRLAVPS